MKAKFVIAQGAPAPPLWTPEEFKVIKAGQDAVDKLPYGKMNPKAAEVSAKAESEARAQLGMS